MEKFEEVLTRIYFWFCSCPTYLQVVRIRGKRYFLCGSCLIQLIFSLLKEKRKKHENKKARGDENGTKFKLISRLSHSEYEWLENLLGIVLRLNQQRLLLWDSCRKIEAEKPRLDSGANLASRTCSFCQD